MKKRRLWLAGLCLIFSICMCFCLAACNSCESCDDDGGTIENTPSVLSVPEVRIDGDGLATWNEVTNASGYAYKIDGGEEKTTENRSVNLTDKQSISVKAVGDGEYYTDSAWSAAKTYTAEPPVAEDPEKLGTPAVTIDIDGKAVWGKVDNAEKYAVKIGEKETEQSGTSVQLKNGDTIQVKAVGDGKNFLTGDFSAVKTYTAPAEAYSAPENLAVEIEGTEKGKVVLSWDEVDGASGYKYVINDNASFTTSENTAVASLAEISGANLNGVWSFKVMTLGDDSDGIAVDGNYSDRRGSSNYCGEVEFSIADEIYTVAEILKIMNYYGDSLPVLREFMVAGTIVSNSDGNAVLESGFTLFGDDVYELNLAIDGRLAGLAVTALGTLTEKDGVKGLLSYRSVDFEDIAENDRYELVIDTLGAWDLLKEDSKIMGDVVIPLKLYGVNLLWTVDDEDTGAFAMDMTTGEVTVTCPADGEEDILVMLSAMLYVDNEHMYEESELSYLIAITSDNRIQLDAPKISIDPKTGVATWAAVENAVRYWYNVYGVIDDDYINWETKYVDITGYVEAGEKPAVQMYNKLWISVKAIGDGVTYKDSEVDPKQYNYYPETVTPDGTPLTFDFKDVPQNDKNELANPKSFFQNACGNAAVFNSVTTTKVYLGNSDVNGAVTGSGFIRVGSSNNDGKITLNFSKKINGVVVTARQWNDKQTDKVSVNGSAEQTASKNDWGIMNFNFTNNTASNTVEINTNNRVFIKQIVVYVAD